MLLKVVLNVLDYINLLLTYVVSTLIHSFFFFRFNISYELEMSSNSSFTNKTLQFTAQNEIMFPSLSLMLIILSSFICVSGFLGNSTIAIIILKCKRMQTPTNWFVFNLTICNLAIGTLTIPYNLINPFINWPFGNIGCKYLIMPVMEHFASVCVLTHTAISLARYTIICKVGIKRIISIKLTRIAISLIWLVSFSVLSVTLMGPLGEFKLQYYKDGKSVCMLKWRSEVKRKVYRVCVFILTYIIPMVTTGYAYYRMHNIFATSLRNVSSSLSHNILLIRRRKTRQLDSTLMTMYSMFALTTLPFQLFLFLYDFHLIPTYHGRKMTFDLLMLIFYTQILSNPFVLLYMSREYRKEISCLSIWRPLFVSML